MFLCRTLTAFSTLLLASVIATAAPAQQDSGMAVAGPTDQDSQRLRDMRAEAYIEAIASEDFEAFLAWYSDHSSTALQSEEARVSFDRYVGEWGGLSPRGILAPAPDTLVIDAEAGNGGQVSLQFAFSSSPPHLVTSITPRYSPPPPPVVVLPDWTDLQALLDAVREQTGVPAVAVGIYDRGRIETAISGVRELGGDDEAQIDDAFDWASVGKSVTGSVIASLVEDGVLRWDSTVGELLEEGEFHPDYRAVPLWMLASHQAGVPAHTNFDMSFEQVISALPGETVAQKRAAYISGMLQEAPEYSPGTDAEYSNGGFMVMGYLAERATGRHWETLVRQHVFAPLGMTHSATRAGANESRVSGHMRAPDGELEPMRRGGEMMLPQIIAAAGGVNGSIGDLTTFAAAHMQGLDGQDLALASADLIRQLHAMQPGQEQFNGENYTFGWGDRCVIEVPEGVTCRSHNGGNGMFFAQILLIPELDIALTLLASNTQAGVRALDPTFAAVLARYRSEQAVMSASN